MVRLRSPATTPSLRDEAFTATLRPDVIVRVGDLPPSKPLRTWLASCAGARQVALDPEDAWQDPDGVLTDSLALEPAAALRDVTPDAAAAEPAWLANWRRADSRASAALAGVLGADELSEPWLAGELARVLGEQDTLFVASSMPVRDVETFWPALDSPPRVLCNRGANGIDGTVASALGALAAVPRGRVVLLVGDVALAHDIGALASLARTPRPLTIVLVNNGGGGIFDFLAVARSPTVEPGLYATHVSTPSGLDFAAAAALARVDYAQPTDRAGAREALGAALASGGPTLIEVRTDRERNVALHAQAWAAVRSAVRSGD